MFRKKNLLSLVISWMLIINMLPGTMAWGAMKWDAQIRPGVMAGDGNNETDFVLDLFLPITGNQKSLLYLNPHLRVDDKGSNEQNIGIGFRTLTGNDRLILGGNIFFDTMRSRNHFRYNQVGFGFEALSKWADFRANYYLPVSKAVNSLGSSGTTTGYFFQNNSLLLGGGMHLEEALRGFDAEAGIMIPFISDVVETRAYAGYYKYNSKLTDDVDGWKIRLEAWPSKLISLNAEVKHDDVRGTDAYVGGYLNIPFSLEELAKGGNPFKGLKEAAAFGKGARSMKERMTEKVVRDRHIVAVEHETGSGGAGQVVIDDSIIFVNQDNPTTGDGSYENPYQNIMDAENNDRYADGAWIYVFSTDENADTFTNGESGVHLTLLPNMVLWGQGYYHPLYQIGGRNGGSDPTMNPILDGMGSGNVITLADNNEIMGLTIQNGEHGIYSYGNAVRNTYIHHNRINNNWGYLPGSGIHMENYFTTAALSNQTLAYRFENNTFNGNSAGIFLYTNITVERGSPITDLANFSVNNIFAQNTFTGNSYGIFAINQIAAQSASGITITNQFDGNSITENANSAIAANTRIFATRNIADVHISNSIINSPSINSTNGFGAYLNSQIIAEANNTSSGPANPASVERTSITNTFTGNQGITGSYSNSGVVLHNQIYSQADINNSAARSTLTDAGILNAFTGNVLEGASITNNIYANTWLYNYTTGEEQTQWAQVDHASVENSFEENTITGSGLRLNNRISATTNNNSHMITAWVTNAAVSNTLLNNEEISSTSSHGVSMSNEIYSRSTGNSAASAAIVDLASILNDISGSTILGTGSGMGVSMSSYIKTEAWRNPHDYSGDDGHAAGVYTGGYVDTNEGEIPGTRIRNLFNGNSITGGIYGAAVSMSNYILSSANRNVLSVYARTIDASIENAFTGNRIEGDHYNGISFSNHILAETEGGRTNSEAHVLGADILNIFFENPVISGLIGTAISMANTVRTRAVSPLGGTTFNADIDSSEINISFSNNNISGIYGISVGNYCQSFAHGTSATASVDNSNAAISFSGNTIDYSAINSGGTGISIYAETYASASNIYAELADTQMSLFFENNTITDYYDGIWLNTMVPQTDGFTFTGDLGGGSFGSTGNNSFSNYTNAIYNSSPFDLFAIGNGLTEDDVHDVFDNPLLGDVILFVD